MDELIRTTAIQWLEKQSLIYGGILPRDLLAQGFEFQGHRITLLGPQGIWKPAIMELPLSIATTINSPYSDKISDDGFLRYSYRGTDPYHRDNVGLRKAMQQGVPLIYFLGVEKGKYLAEWPVFIESDHPENLFVNASIGARRTLLNEDSHAPDLVADAEALYRRRYATSEAIVRLHQGEFRIRVLTAYKEQCAFCHLRHQQLLDAAHIIPDTEEGGEPIVPNGLSLCKIHHAAFDGNIIGVSPDYKIYVREDILDEIDGPMLEYGIQRMHENKIILPNSKNDWPDRERLALRFNFFKKAI